MSAAEIRAFSRVCDVSGAPAVLLNVIICMSFEQSVRLDHLGVAGAHTQSDLFPSLALKGSFRSLFLFSLRGLQDACDADTLLVPSTGLI